MGCFIGVLEAAPPTNVVNQNGLVPSVAASDILQ